MNLLVDMLPKTVKIDHLDYPINTDFRVGILFEQLMQDAGVREDQKLDLAINLYFSNKVFNKSEAIKRILWFYRCGKDVEKTKGSGKSEAPIYDYDYDDAYIYSAFLEQYGIDLQDVKDLHWWKFKALFKSLSKDTKIVEIMGYRSIKIDSKLPKSQKDFYRRMKRIYKLPDGRSEEEKEHDIADIFSSMF